ncbi:response regulator receiver/ANTAR domain-containing protein [Mycobacteroides abscessus subsp. abscessus]|nr:response regulator receiver/ANTAR domain-containing protein [Mycobacteroides abscessus subsp. abscessus]
MSEYGLPEVFDRIAAMARELHDSSQPESALVEQVVQAAVREVPGAQYAGITLAHTNSGRVETQATTHDYPVLLDAIQQHHLEGPCLSATWERDIVEVGDMRSEHRWQKFAADAMRVTPIRSMLCFRLFTSQKTLGALNMYSRTEHAFDEESEQVGYVLATHAALAWDSVRREVDFRSALSSRDVIGQAKGIIMERFHVNAVVAFNMLTRLSQESNTPVAVLAQKLAEQVSSGER